VGISSNDAGREEGAAPRGGTFGKCLGGRGRCSIVGARSRSAEPAAREIPFYSCKYKRNLFAIKGREKKIGLFTDRGGVRMVGAWQSATRPSGTERRIRKAGVLAGPVAQTGEKSSVVSRAWGGGRGAAN